VLAREKEIYAAKARESGKPENIVEKMIEGSLKKYLAEVSLVEQAFVKDPDVKVG
jgi:elongation factor Ts